jgi:hypothetical protein
MPERKHAGAPDAVLARPISSSAKNFREQMLGEDKRAQAMEAAGLLATE